MSKSIISNTKICFVCGSNHNLHKHHIFYGTANRKISEKYGCWIYLCPTHHNMSNSGVHFNKRLDSQLKWIAQQKWEETYGTRKDFICLFGKNYLED
jgi:hypothetical protein